MAPTRSPRPAFRPRLEALDDRITPAPGDLDPTFGAAGIATTTVGQHAFGRDMALQADGKVVTVGMVYQPANKDGTSNHDFVLTRYQANGSPDPTFGGAGVVTTSFGSWSDQGQAVAVQGDGKIVAGGHYTYRNSATSPYRAGFALARYHPTGALDTSFGTGGRVTVQLATAAQDSSRITDVVLLPGGQILAVGNVTNTAGGSNIAVARFLPTGTLDASFGTGGKRVLDLGATENVTGAAVQPDGRVVAAGIRTVMDGSGATDAFALRLLSDGSLDPSFGADVGGDGVRDGYAVIDPLGLGRHNTGSGVALQGANVVLSGRFEATPPVGTTSGQYRPAVTRLTPDGDLDTTFGGDLDGDGTRDGVAVTGPITQYPHAADFLDVVAAPDGRLVAVGHGRSWRANNPSQIDDDLAVARLTPDGTFDPTFGADGIVLNDLNTSGNDYLTAVAVQPDGKIVAAGHTPGAGGKTSIVVARYLGDDPPPAPLTASRSIAPPVFKAADTSPWDDPDPLAPYVG